MRAATQQLKTFILLGLIILYLIFQGCSKLNHETSMEYEYPIIPTPQHAIYGKKEIEFKHFHIEESDFPNGIPLLKKFLSSNGIQSNQTGLKIHIKKEHLSDHLNYELINFEFHILHLSLQLLNGPFHFCVLLFLQIL